MTSEIATLLETQCNYLICGKCITPHCIKRGVDSKATCIILEIYRYIISLEEKVNRQNDEYK